jgi:hypothetical protein
LETITTALVPLLGRPFTAWLFGPDRHGKANQVIEVEVPVNMSDMDQWMVGAAQDAVHFSNVDAVVCSNHDGIQRR